MDKYGENLLTEKERTKSALGKEYVFSYTSHKKAEVKSTLKSFVNLKDNFSTKQELLISREYEFTHALKPGSEVVPDFPSLLNLPIHCIDFKMIKREDVQFKKFLLTL